MKKLEKYFFFSFYFSILTLLFIGPISFCAENDHYTKGRTLAENGHWEGALNTWWQGKLELEKQNQIDPRLGISFINLTTKKQAKEYYESASEIYLWSFSAPAQIEFFEAIVEEAKRLIPLLPEEDQKSWKQLIKNRDMNLATKIKSFWLGMDFRPTTEVNERLIEHWERIQFSREKFKKNKVGVYNCDDRGTIYVKYGKPDRKEHGRFGTSITSISIARQWTGKKTILDDPTPEYEVWAYDEIGTEEPSIFLFSYRYAREEYGLQPGVDFVVPQFLGTTKKDYRAMYMLKYYAELMLFDDFFYDRFSRIRQIFETSSRDRGGNTKSYIAMVNQVYHANKAQDQLNPIYKYADEDRSEYVKNFGEIKVAAFSFRHLDFQNNAKLAIITATSPQFSGETILQKTEDGLKIAGFKLLSTMIIRDQKYNEIDRKSALQIDDFENISCFQFDHTPDYHRFTFASELYNQDSDSILAIGKEVLSPSSVLLNHPDSLEMSDIIVGVTTQETKQYKFPVFPAQEFWRDNSLNIYFEIYHLEQNSKNKSSYTIEIGAIELDKKGIRKKKDETQISFLYDLESDSTRVQEQYGIDISKLKPGFYELFVKIRDKFSFQEKIRKVRFKINKN